MIALSDKSPMTPEEYLAFEKTSEIRHEYVDGELYAMAGASKNHNLISGNLYLLLRGYLRNSGCTTYIADVKVKLPKSKKFFYPDLLVTCDPNDDADEMFVKTPQVIIEVLSPSTQNFDQVKKFQYYRTIPTLQNYLLIHTDDYKVDCFRRQTEDIWTIQFYKGIEAIAHLETLDINLPLTKIYEGVIFSKSEDINQS